MIVYVIYKILWSAKVSQKDLNVIKHNNNKNNFSKTNIKRVYHSKNRNDFNYTHKKYNNSQTSTKKQHSNVKFKNHVVREESNAGINKSSQNIQFESNDLLGEYKK